MWLGSACSFRSVAGQCGKCSWDPQEVSEVWLRSVGRFGGVTGKCGKCDREVWNWLVGILVLSWCNPMHPKFHPGSDQDFTRIDPGLFQDCHPRIKGIIGLLQDAPGLLQDQSWIRSRIAPGLPRIAQDGQVFSGVPPTNTVTVNPAPGAPAGSGTPVAPRYDTYIGCAASGAVQNALW